MHHRSETTNRRAPAWAIGLALLVAGCNSNSLQTAESDPVNDLLGDPLVMLGLKADPNREQIEYGPRSPLVVPAEAQLPPPQQQVADYGADWPDDPDVRARREYEAAARAAAQETVKDVEMASRPMTRAELDDWGRRFGRVDPNPQYGRSLRESSAVVSPEELRASGADPNAPGPEPERRTLTEPPAGYRAPAPTAPMPVQEEKKGFFSRLFGG